MSDWLAMGGYAGYVWGSYGMALIAIGAELVALAARKRRALVRAAAEAEHSNGV